MPGPTCAPGRPSEPPGAQPGDPGDGRQDDQAAADLPDDPGRSEHRVSDFPGPGVGDREREANPHQPDDGQGKPQRPSRNGACGSASPAAAAADAGGDEVGGQQQASDRVDYDGDLGDDQDRDEAEDDAQQHGVKRFPGPCRHFAQHARPRQEPVPAHPENQAGVMAPMFAIAALTRATRAAAKMVSSPGAPSVRATSAEPMPPRPPSRRGSSASPAALRRRTTR